MDYNISFSNSSSIRNACISAHAFIWEMFFRCLKSLMVTLLQNHIHRESHIPGSRCLLRHITCFPLHEYSWLHLQSSFFRSPRPVRHHQLVGGGAEPGREGRHLGQGQPRQDPDPGQGADIRAEETRRRQRQQIHLPEAAVQEHEGDSRRPGGGEPPVRPGGARRGQV